MIQFRSISHRLIAAIAATVVVACATLGGFSLAQQQAVTGLALDQELRLQYENVIAALDYEAGPPSPLRLRSAICRRCRTRSKRATVRRSTSCSCRPIPH